VSRQAKALAVDESEQPLFGPADMDLGLCWARLTLLDPQLGPLFRLRGVVTHHRFVHGES
jgi:hypothetical protein